MQAKILICLIWILATVLTAKYIFHPQSNTASYFINIAKGTELLLAMCSIYNIFHGLVKNYKARKDISIPLSIKDLDAIGIQTPLDYCFLMSILLVYPHEPLLLINLNRGTEYVYSTKIIRRSIQLFETRFGRKPYGYETMDWYIMLTEESRAVFEYRETNVQFEVEDLLANISPDVLNFCNMTAYSNAKQQTIGG